MPRIVIEALPKDKMRYDSLGDWFVNADGDHVIQVVGDDPMTDDRAFLVALHELVEAKLCAKRGISQQSVDDFDLAYSGGGEPGDAENAPYRREHRQACLLEFLVADMLGMTDYGTVE